MPTKRTDPTHITLAQALDDEDGGVERPFNCPVHDDVHASASVNVEKNVWYCYACGAKGRAKDKNKAPSPSYLLSVLTGDAEPRVYPEHWLDVFDIATVSPYWAERVGEEVARRHRCGTHPENGNPTYPLRGQKGEVWGVVERNLDPDDKRKYLYPFDVSTSRTLFGWELAVPRCPVVLCEGASDVMAVEQALDAGPADTVTVLGVYGSGAHVPQLVMLKRLRPSMVVSCFDADEAGQKATARLAVAAAENHWPFVSVDWGKVGAKDAGEADIESRRRVVLGAVRR